jgi:2-polyprenyl-6-methoxyphenol hydroxylase-like FAD-dependent oxidoreductase
MQADVVIAGGGIGGAVLAELLGRGGKRVVVLERSTAPPNWLRPEILWPATVEVLFSLAPRRVWEQAAMLPLQGLHVHDNQKFVQLVTQEVMAAARVQAWFTNPNETREQLLRLGSFDLRRGVAVTQVLKERERVIGVRTQALATGQETEILATWTVGDDGVRSVVREACGIDMPTRLFPVQFLGTALTWLDHLPAGTVHLWPNWCSGESGLLAFGAGSLPGGRGVGLALIDGRRFDANPDVVGLWRRFCVKDPALERVVASLDFPHGFVRIKRPWGHAPRYGAPGAVLMGDAAHSVSPAGGQGANMSVADAVVLAELFLRGESDLIDQYERRRRSANERSFRPTRFAEKVFQLPGWTVPNACRRALLRWLSRHPAPVQRTLRAVSGLFQEGSRSSPTNPR